MRMACSGWTSCTRSDSNESQSPGSLIGASRNGTHGGGLRMLSIRVGFSLLTVAAAGWGQEVSEKIEFFESRCVLIVADASPMRLPQGSSPAPVMPLLVD